VEPHDHRSPANAANGGTCDAAPTAVTARVFQADGTTPVSGPLAAGTDFSATWNGSPSCTVSFTMISAAAVVGPDQRLIVTYQTVLDAGSQDGVTLTNIAGATQWFSADASSSQRRTFTRTITDGTVGTLDFQDAHTIIVGLPNYLFEKTVTNVTTGQSPATQASPGDRLRYQLRIENLGVASLDNLSIVDDLDRLNTPARVRARHAPDRHSASGRGREQLERDRWHQGHGPHRRSQHLGRTGRECDRRVRDRPRGRDRERQPPSPTSRCSRSAVRRSRRATIRTSTARPIRSCRTTRIRPWCRSGPRRYSASRRSRPT
jgi:hypothetical protein